MIMIVEILQGKEVSDQLIYFGVLGLFLFSPEATPFFSSGLITWKEQINS